MSSATPAPDDDGRRPPSTITVVHELYAIRKIITALLTSSADSAFKTLHRKTNAPELLTTFWLNEPANFLKIVKAGIKKFVQTRDIQLCDKAWPMMQKNYQCPDGSQKIMICFRFDQDCAIESVPGALIVAFVLESPDVTVWVFNELNFDFREPTPLSFPSPSSPERDAVPGTFREVRLLYYLRLVFKYVHIISKEFVDDLVEMFDTGGNFEKLLPPMQLCDASLDDFTTIISGMAHILAGVKLSKTAVVRHHIMILVEDIPFTLNLDLEFNQAESDGGNGILRAKSTVMGAHLTGNMPATRLQLRFVHEVPWDVD